MVFNIFSSNKLSLTTIIPLDWNISLLTENRTVHYIEQTTSGFLCVRFHWYTVQSIIVYNSLAVKDFKFLQT